MDFDLDFLERKGKRRGKRSARYMRDDDSDHGGARSVRYVDEDDDRYRDRGPSMRRSRRSGFSRRAHPHMFAWLLLGGGVVLLGAALMVIASSLGIWGYIADGYFAIANAVLPSTWQDEFAGLPGIAHVAMVLGGLFVAAGIAGEVFD
jgi:hypothetical protein